MYRSFMIYGSVIAIGLITIACKALGPKVEAREEFSFNKPASGKKSLTLENVNGAITITGVEGLAEVQITGVKIAKGRTDAEAKQGLGDVKIVVNESDSGISVTTDQPNGDMAHSYEVNYEIKVPRDWHVSVENDNGNIKLASLTSGVEASTTNGDIASSGVAGSIDAEVVNGRITGDMKIPEHGSCALSTTNGTIDTKMEMPASATARLETTNGKISLAIPKGTSARVTADANVGAVDVNDLQFSGLERSRENMTGETLSGTLGAGGGSIDLDVTNGKIALSGY